MVLLSNTITRLPVELRTSTPLPDRDYLFKSSHSEVYAHIVDVNIPFIYVKNNTNSAIIIPRYTDLETLVEYNAEYYYTVYPDQYKLIVERRELKVHAPKGSSEIKLENDISICNNESQVAKLKALIAEYGDI